jgi:hypothetical protein
MSYTIGDIIEHPYLGVEDPKKFKQLILSGRMHEASQMGYEDPIGTKTRPTTWVLLNIHEGILIFAPCIVLSSPEPEEILSEYLDYAIAKTDENLHTYETTTEAGHPIIILSGHCILRDADDLNHRPAIDRIRPKDAEAARPKLGGDK